MNLLIDCHCFDIMLSQGITTYIQGLYQELPSLCPNIEFHFAASNVNKIMSIFNNGNNIHYIPLSSKNRIYRLLFEFPAIIKKYKIDIAHFQYVAPLIKNCKTIVTLHDILFVDYPEYFPFTYRFFKGSTFKLSAKRADLLCTVSDYSRKQISKHYGIDPDKIVITPNAVSENFYSIEGVKPKKFPEKYILYVSRIEPRKNHIAIVKSFERLNLAKEGYNLVFIGKETIATPELHQAIENLPNDIKGHVLIIPQASFSDLKLWYKYASLFVYPTVAEGFGIPPIEAGAAEVPVICNNATAMSDFSFFGENLINVADNNMLDSRIIACLSKTKPSSLKEISQKIRTTYNWHTIAEDFNKSLNQFR